MEEKKVKHKYIFPNFLANFMSKVDMRTQYEASMMSMTLMMCGMFITAFYLGFYTDFPLWYKITIVLNLLAAFVFMSSFVVTTYQQYQSYMDVVEYQKDKKKWTKVVKDVAPIKMDLKGGENAEENKE